MSYLRSNRRPVTRQPTQDTVSKHSMDQTPMLPDTEVYQKGDTPRHWIRGEEYFWGQYSQCNLVPGEITEVN